MSNSKPLPPFTFDLLCYLNRDQLERFTIASRLLKNLIDRYFSSKPYRIFDNLHIRGGTYALVHDVVHVQPFLAIQKCDMNSPWKKSWRGFLYYPFAEMRPYLSPNVRIKFTWIYIAGDSMYSPEHIEEMESIAYLWRDGEIRIVNDSGFGFRFGAEDFRPILNSPTILKCQRLFLYNALFPFKDHSVLYSVKVIYLRYDTYIHDKHDIDLWQQYWQQFLEQPGVKPVVAFDDLSLRKIDSLLKRLFKTFSSAVSPNPFKIVFSQMGGTLPEFRETNNASSEIFELKEGLPAEIQNQHFLRSNYTLERSNV
ncbi:hypothetical protein DdX_17637 [Ditylenchus destructor]|uniref:Uncharacterized protein n=1 Tax=Ditylenchus destructor TaxID=166010 RepID=A0AAD4MM84_9BILA|nr:hypothetical protein DdX_17637 [Ditylenchus destructor]